ncbi:MAG: hypothetical protein JNM30_10985 [Rhodospirillales bacterium]|nr:hypothetical protein [Rhodospirillales bacterium]
MLEAEAAIAPQAWRVEFAEGARIAPDGGDAITISEPRSVTAVLTPLATSDALAEVSPQTAGALIVIWMPPGANTPATIERDVDEWVRGAGTERKEANARADVRTLRVAWGRNRTVVYANEGDVRLALDAILRFSLAQRETLALNAAMRSMWPSIEADATFTHALTPRDRKKQPHINEMTVTVTRMKIAWLRLKASLEQVDPALAEPSKRLFAELAAAVFLYDQVDVLGPKVQFALDHYEIANTRLIDMTLVRQERIESIAGYGMIIVLLVFQTWLIFQDLW